MQMAFFRKPGGVFLLFAIAAVFINFFSINIPFFWDNVSISEYICFYNDNSFNSFIPPAITDFGAPTLNAFYLAVMCSIFGKSLVVCHLAIIPFVLGILWEIKNISAKFIKPEFLGFVYLIVLFDPAFSTQIVLMSYDIFLLYFSLLAVRTLLEEKHLKYSISLLFLSTLSFRALFFIFSLVIIHVIIITIDKKRWPGLKDFFVYIPAIALSLFWFIFHYIKTGWVILNPTNLVHLSMNHGEMILRQFVFILWKLADSGRIILWLFLIIGIFTFYKKLKLNSNIKELLTLLFIPLGINCLIMVFLSNPVGHKYFLITFVFLSITTVVCLQEIKSQTARGTLITLIIIFLFTGNFIIYPQKYGNAWETSLKVIPYFKMEKEFAHYVKQQNIKPSEVFSFYPLTNNHKFTDFSEDFKYSDAEGTPLKECQYFILSNIYNIKNPDKIRDTIQNWQLLKSSRKGQVSMALYKNPAFIVNE